MLTPIFCATIWECEDALNKKLYGFKKEFEAPFEVWRNDTKRVIISGIGLVNASVAFAWAAREFDFENALNIGAAGLTYGDKNSTKPELGHCYNIASVNCLEPYNERIFKIADDGKTLVTASRPISTLEQRKFAGTFGELVDMEGYSLARSAEIFDKKLSMIKMVTDFSQDCDIHANILELSKGFADMEEIWS